jgi:hypothetical protein
MAALMKLLGAVGGLVCQSLTQGRARANRNETSVLGPVCITFVLLSQLEGANLCIDLSRFELMS